MPHYVEKFILLLAVNRRKVSEGKNIIMQFKSLRLLTVLAIIVSNIVTPFAQATTSLRQEERISPSQRIYSETDFQARLARMEQLLEEKRRQSGVPGMSVVIVKDDKIVYAKGFGMRDVEKNLPVTAETIFPIGSNTKAFTGMLLAMSADDGKLSFADSPRKYLPYFKLQDAEADKKITLRDLMIHNSGLAETDLIWQLGTLNRHEVIRALSQAKPTAAFGERFQYQNIMVSAAGEAIARAHNSTWERLVSRRIFKPLGMTRTVLSLPAMTRSKNYAFGYRYDQATKKAERLPYRRESATSSIAPAGAIYSNADEMGNWLRLMLNGGMYDGKRLVSEKNFGEIVSPQLKNINNSGVDYGLGWFILNRKGSQVLQHGGSIDGFRAKIALMPEERLGFVILTNSHITPLLAPGTIGGGTAEEIIWSNLLDEPQTEETPVSKNPSSAAAMPRPEGDAEKYRELTGTYEAEVEGRKLTFRLAAQDGKFSVLRAGQRARALIEKSSDAFSIAGVPDTFGISVKRNGAGKAVSILFKQPNGSVELPRVEDFKSPISTEELRSKVVAALGGEANLRKHRTMEMTYDIDFVNQGVTGTGTISAETPNFKSNTVVLSALGKRVGTIREYFDGVAGGSESSFQPPRVKNARESAQELIASDFYEPLKWDELYKTIEITGTTKVGDEETYVVVKTPETGAPVTDFISTKSYLPIRRNSTSGVTKYDDYRTVDGVMLPFKWTIENSDTGEQIINVKTAKFDVPIADSVFIKTPGKD